MNYLIEKKEQMVKYKVIKIFKCIIKPKKKKVNYKLRKKKSIIENNKKNDEKGSNFYLLN